MRSHSNEHQFDLHENGSAGETMNGFTKTRFKTEAKGNSEMAYSLSNISRYVYINLF